MLSSNQKLVCKCGATYELNIVAKECISEPVDVQSLIDTRRYVCSWCKKHFDTEDTCDLHEMWCISNKKSEPVAVFQSPNIVRNIRDLTEFKDIAQQFRDDLGYKIEENKKKIKADGNKLIGFIVTPDYKAMLYTFCPDLIQLPIHSCELPMMFGMPIEEGEVSSIAFKFEKKDEKI